MKTEFETFNDVQKVSRFICNSTIPFAYELDLSEVGTPLSETHAIRIIEKSTGSVISVTLSDSEAEIITKSDDPLDYLRRWLSAFRDTKQGGTMKPEKMGVKSVKVFDEGYFIAGHAYHMCIKRNASHKYEGVTTDIIIRQFDRYRHTMTVVWFDNFEMQTLDISVDDYINGDVSLSRLAEFP